MQAYRRAANLSSDSARFANAFQPFTGICEIIQVKEVKRLLNSYINRAHFKSAGKEYNQIFILINPWISSKSVHGIMDLEVWYKTTNFSEASWQQYANKYIGRRNLRRPNSKQRGIRSYQIRKLRIARFNATLFSHDLFCRLSRFGFFRHPYNDPFGIYRWSNIHNTLFETAFTVG